MGMESTDVEFIQGTLRLSDQEATLLNSFTNPKEGRAILCAGVVHIPIFVRASQAEKDMFETSAQGLRKIKETRQKQKV